MRQRCKRILKKDINEIYFKPKGIPLYKLKEVIITDEELETLRLRYVEKLDQNESSKEMGVSQSQYQRDLTQALEKITIALIKGYAINIRKKINEK